ncbi:conjugal transfer protein TraB [Streptomyces mayteni]
MSNEIVPRPTYLPDVPDGEGLGFLVLAARVTALTARALLLKEKLWALQRHMARNADKAHTTSEMCDAAEVKPEQTALILETSTALRKVADASGEVANAADDMQTDAQAFGDAHETEYRGVYEAVQVAGGQAKPGFYEVR